MDLFLFQSFLFVKSDTLDQISNTHHSKMGLLQKEISWLESAYKKECRCNWSFSVLLSTCMSSSEAANNMFSVIAKMRKAKKNACFVLNQQWN